MKLFSIKNFTKRKRYRSERMGVIRSEVIRWMQEYEQAKTAKHRDLCMNQIEMNLRKYAFYGNTNCYDRRC